MKIYVKQMSIQKYMNSNMNVKTSNNNYYPINIDCSNTIYKHNEVDLITNKIKLEKECKEMDNKLFETKQNRRNQT